MLGAIAGDIIGSAYEFLGQKSKDFPLFRRSSCFTDDTVLTIAVAEALMDGGDDEALTERCVRESLQKYGRMFPDVDYGGMFVNWIFSDDALPYNSWGNGSAMRVSPVGWLFGALEETERFAAVTARVTHNHPEGIKGAMATAAAIFMARTGSSQAQIRDELERRYGYDLHRRMDDIRPDYHFELSCQESVPQAIIAFLEGRDYEDTVRNAVSLGGDADTQACIAGGIAEAFWGLPDEIAAQALERLDARLKTVMERWTRYLSRRRTD